MAGYDYDVVVIGGGPGGYVAGIRAAQLGLKAAVIERDKVGGVCLNVGCIPSKALIHQAELFRSIPSLTEMGLTVDTKGFDYKNVFDKSRKAADTLVKGVQFLLKKNKVETIVGEGAISGKNEVTLKDGKKVTGKNIVIATGSRPRVIPGFEFDEQRVLSSTGAIMLSKLPKKAIILGAGAIGVEFSHVLNSFGVEVHLVEMLDRILPIEDAEAVQVLARAFQKRGIQMNTGTKAVSMQKGAAGVSVVLEDKAGKRTTVEADQILVVVGRTPNTDGIGLEKVGITTEKGFIPVEDYNQTRVPGSAPLGTSSTRRSLRTWLSRRRRSPRSTWRESHRARAWIRFPYPAPPTASHKWRASGFPSGKPRSRRFRSPRRASRTEAPANRLPLSSQRGSSRCSMSRRRRRFSACTS